MSPSRRWTLASCSARYSRNRKVADVICPQPKKRLPGYESGPREKLPSDATIDFSEEGLSGLLQRELQTGCDSVAVYIVVYVAINEAGCNPISVFLKVQLPADGKASTPVVGNESSRPDNLWRRDFVVLTQGENVAEYGYKTGADCGT